MMKKAISLLLALIFVMSLAACGGSSAPADDTNAPAENTQPDGAQQPGEPANEPAQPEASYGLDNPVKAEWEAGLAKMNYNEDVFAPDKETVLMMEPDLIFSWGSLFSDKNLDNQDRYI